MSKPVSAADCITAAARKHKLSDEEAQKILNDIKNLRNKEITMLINKYNKYNKSNGNRVRFISYTGRYPNLCSGVLTLEIDGNEYKFGHDYSYYRNGKYMDEDPNNPNFESFWISGGCIAGGMEDLHAETEEWRIDADALPEQFRDIADEIDEVFNANVPWGCCGGCI